MSQTRSVFPQLSLILLGLTHLYAQQEVKPMALDDLVLGMPRDLVLAGLKASGYSTSEEVTGSDFWAVLSGDRYSGEIGFKGGKLRVAFKRLWTQGDPDPILADRLFQVLFSQSSRSNLQENEDGTLSRVRDGSINFEIAEDTTFGHLQRQIKFLAGGSLFVLSVTDLPPTPRYLALDKSILSNWQPDTKSQRK